MNSKQINYFCKEGIPYVTPSYTEIATKLDNFFLVGFIAVILLFYSSWILIS